MNEYRKLHIYSNNKYIGTVSSVSQNDIDYLLSNGGVFYNDGGDIATISYTQVYHIPKRVECF